MIKIRSYITLLIFLFFLSACGSYHDELKKIPEYMELTKTVASMPQFKNFPPMSSWLFLIDQRKQDGGPFVFDKEEPGYLAGMSKGMNFALINYQKKLTVEFLEKSANMPLSP